MTTYTDETLTAFLDGVLNQSETNEIMKVLETDADLGERLAALSVDFDEIRQDFDSLLEEAPAFEPPVDNTDGEATVVPFKRPFMQRSLLFVAAACLALIVGFGVGRNTVPLPEPQKPGWLAVVASYQKLYSAQTLEGVSPSVVQASSEVAQVSAALALDLDFEQLQLDGLKYRRGQLLNFNGKPLAQFMFQDANGTPIAICVIKSAITEKPASSKTIDGMNAVAWNQGGFGYLIIGGTTTESLSSAADQLQQQI